MSQLLTHMLHFTFKQIIIQTTLYYQCRKYNINRINCLFLPGKEFEKEAAS